MVANTAVRLIDTKAESADILDNKKVISQEAIIIAPDIGCIANNPPRKVATPFPPLSLRKIEKQWPRTANIKPYNPKK